MCGIIVQTRGRLQIRLKSYLAQFDLHFNHAKYFCSLIKIGLSNLKTRNKRNGFLLLVLLQYFRDGTATVIMVSVTRMAFLITENDLVFCDLTIRIQFYVKLRQIRLGELITLLQLVPYLQTSSSIIVCSLINNNNITQKEHF